VQAGVLNFDRHAENLQTLTVPTLVAWAEDDRLIEPEIFAEQTALCPDGPRLGFDTGGHNIQKTRAVELADALLAICRSS